MTVVDCGVWGMALHSWINSIVMSYMVYECGETGDLDDSLSYVVTLVTLDIFSEREKNKIG